MPRTLASASGPCPTKAALRAQGINPNKRLLTKNSRVNPRRMTAKSEPSRPRCTKIAEKIFQSAINEAHALTKSSHTETAPQLPIEEKVEDHTEKQTVKKGSVKKEVMKKEAVKKEATKKPIAKKPVAKKSIAKKMTVKKEEKL